MIWLLKSTLHFFFIHCAILSGMERLIVFTVALMVSVALGVDGSSHLSFADNTTQVGFLSLFDICDLAGNFIC